MDTKPPPDGITFLDMGADAAHDSALDVGDDESVIDSAVPKDGQSPVQDGAPPTPGKSVDILFVVDNTASMDQEQTNLVNNFPKLIDALRNYKLGPDSSGKPCTLTDSSGCDIPDLHIGVVSADLGGGNYGLPQCDPPGDGAKLQNAPRVPGCVPPKHPWIGYANGVSNVASGSTDPIQRVKDAFKCIAQLGTDGCGFEFTIESARRALDPQLNINPGFVRAGAPLAVVFITDEDDCSAQKIQLFDPTQQGLNDLGPLTSFRCFEFGIQCDINDRTVGGPRNNCVPAYDWLYKIDDYIKFFQSLKPAGQLVMAAIAGPTSPVEVNVDGPNPVLEPSCMAPAGVPGGGAVPGIRIRALVDAFNGFYSSICEVDFGPALAQIGALISP